MAHRDSVGGFRLMALSYKIRDALKARRPYLAEAGVGPGMILLDFGCGPGSYVIPAAMMVGATGRVYALDRHPTALEMTTARAEKTGLANVETIRSDRETGLPGHSVDVVLLYDIVHHLESPDDVLRELHRVLKPSGVLSTHDHHLNSERLKQAIESSGLFRLTRAGGLTLTFAPAREDT
jgi:ubiquinone/menaquinone biosynthesis C-methylase UbiE